MDFDWVDREDIGTEKQLLTAWREEKVRVSLLGNETAEGRIKAVTERASSSKMIWAVASSSLGPP